MMKRLLLVAVVFLAAGVHAATPSQPAVQFVAPADDHLHGTVDLQLDAPAAATSVHFYLDDVHLSELTDQYARATHNAPVWATAFDADWFPAGPHLLRALVTTPEGTTSVSKRVVLTGKHDANSISLDGAWRFAPADGLPQGQQLGPQPEVVASKFDDRGWPNIVVPDSLGAVDQRWMRPDGLLGTYRRRIELASVGSKDSRLFLVSDSCYWSCRYFVNGIEVGASVGGYLPRRFDITHAARRGSNAIAVIVDDRPATMGVFNRLRHFYWHYAGLLQDLRIEQTAATALIDLRAQGAANGDLTLSVTSINGTDREQRLTGLVDVIGPDGGAVLSSQQVEMRVPADGGKVEPIKLHVDKPRLWDLEHPNLYRVRLRDIGGDRARELSEATGFRDIEIKGADLLLNGAAVSGLQGFNQHLDYPGLGKTQPGGLVDREMKRLHDKGFRIFRPGHYPATPAELAAADKYGILVLEEINVTGLKAVDLQSPAVLDFARQQLQRMIDRDRSHPSIFGWSVGNENRTDQPGSDVYLRDTIQFGKQLDPTRPFTQVSAQLMHDICYAFEDFVAVNIYAGWYTDKLTDVVTELDKVEPYAGNKPMLITEYGAEAVFNRSGFDKGTEYFQALTIDTHNRFLRNRPHLIGKMYWTSAEFVVSPKWDGGNPAPVPPFHTKGLLTYFRQPKLGWRVMFSPIEMDEIAVIDGAVQFPAEATRTLVLRNVTPKPVSGKLIAVARDGTTIVPAEQAFAVPGNAKIEIPLEIKIRARPVKPEGEPGAKPEPEGKVVLGTLRAVIDADAEALPALIRMQ